MAEYKLWNTIEIKILQTGLYPEGRTPRACRVFCKRHGIPFAGKKKIEANEQLIKDIETRYKKND